MKTVIVDGCEVLVLDGIDLEHEVSNAKPIDPELTKRIDAIFERSVQIVKERG